MATGAREAAERLADSFHGSGIPADEHRDGATVPATSEIEAVRLAVQRAEAAAERLASETQATQHELERAQHVVDRAVVDVVRQKLLAIARLIDEHDSRRRQLRASVHAADYATANVPRRPAGQASGSSPAR
jgi:hypothetical protein